MAKVQLSVALDLDNVEVLKVEFEGETIHIQVESTLKYARGERCGRKIGTFHGYGDWVKGQHLPSFGRAELLWRTSKCLSISNEPGYGWWGKGIEAPIGTACSNQ